MFKVDSYLENSTTTYNYNNPIKDLVKFVIDHKEDVEKELRSLGKLNNTNPNKVFPIKIENLVNGFNCFETLNYWYNVEPLKRAQETAVQEA